MPALALSTTLLRTTCLPFESFPVEVQVENQGAAPCQLSDPEWPTPFRFELLRAEDGERLHSFDVRRYKLALNPNTKRFEPPELQTVQPGGSLLYQADLGALTHESIRPGAYQLVVSLLLDGQTHAAPPVDIEVLAPAPSAEVAVGQDLKGGLAGFFAQPVEGGVRLLQWAAPAGNPTLTAARCREQDAGPVSGMAVGLDNPAHRAGRWYAWLAAGQLTGIRVWDTSLSRRSDPLALELEEARLLEVGRKLDDGAGQFLVAGIAAGQALVRRVVLEGKVVRAPEPATGGGGTPGMKPPPAPPSAAPRLETHDHPWPGGALPQHLQARYQPDGGIQLVGVVQDGAAFRVVAAELGDGPLEPRTCFELEAPCLGLAVPPWQEAGAGYADALFGPLGEDDARAYVFVRLPLDEGAPEAREWRFAEAVVLPKPEEEEAEPPAIEGWQLCRGPAAHPPLAARVGEHFLLGWPSKGGKSWEPLGGEVEAGARLRLLACARADAYKRRLFALLIDPRAGMRTLALGR